MKWYNREPENSLGVIVYLTTVGQLSQLNASLLSLRQFLFKPRPVVVFHEGDFNDVNVQLALANTLGSNALLAFEHIRFPTKIMQQRMDCDIIGASIRQLLTMTVDI
ncbi:unnamed protein product [Rotaria magnacalcarata]|uniref:Uncharacterized protein n=1 Tax=Rotaria magnacalcarata TaxID=392030 RepID=A0A819ZGF1_9BILA|nr:unnamed protein product [Rotaria magnacalcarata]